MVSDAASQASTNARRTEGRGLDCAPLPDEAFQWAGVPDDIVDRVQEVLELVDRCCDVLLDVEHRTACRRLLARVASRGPEAFRRKAKAENSAAAVVWMIGKVNDVFNLYRNERRVKEFMRHFGVWGSASQRANVMLQEAEFDSATNDLTLGSPDYRVADRRRSIIDSRHRYRKLLTGDASGVIDLDR